VAPGRLEQVQRADGVRIEIFEGNLGCTVMGGLGGRVDNQSRLDFFDDLADPRPIPYVNLVVSKARESAFKAPLVPPRIPLGTEENRSLIVVDPVNLEPTDAEVEADFRSDQPVGAGNEDSLPHESASGFLESMMADG